MKVKKRWFALFLLLWFAYGIYSPLTVVSTKLYQEQIDSPLKIALITDLHSCRYGDNQEELLTPLREHAPDIVLLGGDIVDDEMPEEAAWALIEACAKLYPTYYVTGNHEYWTGDIERIRRMMRSYGVHVLENEVVRPFSSQPQIVLTGVEDKEMGRWEWRDQLSSLSKVNDAGDYNILLTHRPEAFQDYKELGYDLVLAGHAHGGQFRIPFLINGVFAPNQGFFPPYAGGEYVEGDQMMIVSRGLARESTRIPRFYNRPELWFIELLPESTKP